MNTISTRHFTRVVHYEFGDPCRVLHVEEFSERSPLKPGSVRIRITRSIIHPGDLQLVAAKFSLKPASIPGGRVPGAEAVGIVAEAYPGALEGHDIKVGDRVIFFAQGAWSSEVIIPSEQLIRVPDDISDEVATQLLVNTLTAKHVLRTAEKCVGLNHQTLVLTAAASAVGKLIASQALSDGLHLIRLVRSRESAERLAKDIPGGHIINTASVGWQNFVRQAATGDIPLVIDGVGGPMVSEIAHLLNTGGTMISFGLLDGGPADMSMFIPKRLNLRGVTIETYKQETAKEDQVMDIATAISVARKSPKLFSAYQLYDVSNLKRAVDAVNRPSKTGNILINFEG